MHRTGNEILSMHAPHVSTPGLHCSQAAICGWSVDVDDRGWDGRRRIVSAAGKTKADED